MLADELTYVITGVVTLSRQGKAERGEQGRTKGRKEEGKVRRRKPIVVSVHEEVCAWQACKRVVVITITHPLSE